MLRPYQQVFRDEIERAWAAGARNVLGVLPTGGGKTVVFSDIIEREPSRSVVMAHRSEIVGQISLALARNGVVHQILAPDAVRSEIEAAHLMELGRRYVDQHSRTVVAGVKTLVSRAPGWLAQVGLWVVDEAHHLTLSNQWGEAIKLMPGARGLGVTATPHRADGRGLGRHADGVMDALVVGPGMRDLIRQKYLTDYIVFCPPSDLDLTGVDVGASGDYVGDQLREAVKRSHLVGDVVATYVQHAMGRLGLTFTVDVESAVETAEEYRRAGVPAEVLSAKTPTGRRAAVMRSFRAGKLWQLVNCDLLGEGTDVPAVECVSFARPTMSLTVYRQQFGRACRILEGKTRAVVFDHAGNVGRHGLPDSFVEWSLDRRERRSKAGPSLMTVCPQCTATYERINWRCPYCEYEPEPAERSSPAHVAGDLVMLDPETAAQMRGEIARVDSVWNASGHEDAATYVMRQNHARRQLAQAELRHSIALYGGWRERCGDGPREAQRRFYLTFGLDVYSAMCLGRSEADGLKILVDGIVNKALH